MKPITYGRTAPPSSLPRIFLMLGMLAVGGAGSIVVLYAAGVVDLPFLNGKAPEKPRPPGIQIVKSSQPVPAYTMVTRDYILDPTTGELVVAYVPPEERVKYGYLTFEQFVDYSHEHRVLGADLAAGRPFQEKDFLPPGTKPGVSAGVPDGKISYVLDARQVDGINDLKQSDHIDVLGAVMIEFDKTTRTYHTIPTAPNRAGTKLEYKEGQTAIVEALAEDAVVVRPLTTREVPDEGAPIPVQTGKPKMRVTRDVTIAIDPKEAGKLTEAVAVGGEIFVVAHTGLPDALRTQTPGFAPLTPIQTVETFVGNKREFKYFADPNGRLPSWSPAPEPADKKSPSPASPAGPTKVAEEKSEASSEPRP